jgi:putative ABC transport system ATP-binding protein
MTPVASGDPVVRARGLDHFFGTGDVRKQVLFDNHLLVAAGEIVIVTGPSGSGKTTLLTLIGAHDSRIINVGTASSTWPTGG